MKKKDVIAEFTKNYDTRIPELMQTVGECCLSALYEQGDKTTIQGLVRLGEQALRYLEQASPGASDPFENWRNGGRSDQ